MGFWDYFAPAAGAILGGGIGSEFGDAGRIIGAGLGAGAGSKLAGNDWGTAGLAAALGAGGSAALPYLTNSLGIDTTGFNFLDKSFGMPGAASGDIANLPTQQWGTGSDTLQGDSGWDTLAGDLQPGEYEYIDPETGLITLQQAPTGQQLGYMTSDLGLPPVDAAQAARAAEMTNAEALGLANVNDVIGNQPAPQLTPSQDVMLNGGLTQAGILTPGGESTSAQPGFFDRALNGAKNQWEQNPLGIGLAGAGLLYAGANAMRESPEEKALRDQAARADAQGAAMQQYLATGTLPPGLQASVDQATNAAKAKIRSDYAQKGLTGSSMERDALANVDLQAKAQAGQLAVSLMNSGAQQSGMSSNIYNYLLRSSNQEDQATAQALAQFAASMVPQNRKAA